MIRRRREWVSSQGLYGEELERTLSPQVKVERDWGKTCETAAGRARQGLHVLLCSELGRTKKAGCRWTGDRKDATGGEVYVKCRDMGVRERGEGKRGGRGSIPTYAYTLRNKHT